MPGVIRLFTDGAARGNPGPAGLGVVIADSEGMKLAGASGYLGEVTNNVAEYRALIAGLRKVADWNPDRVDVFMDSKLVVEQMKGNFKIKNAELQKLSRQAHDLVGQLREVTFTYIPREQNRGADALANRAIDEHSATGAQT